MDELDVHVKYWTRNFSQWQVSQREDYGRSSQNFELDGVKMEREEYITEIELLRGNLRKWLVTIDDVEMMTHILSNLTEAYKNIVKSLEEKSEFNIYMLTIKIFQDKLSAKYDNMNVRSNQTEGK